MTCGTARDVGTVDAGRPRTPSGDRSVIPLNALALGLVALAGFLCLAMPFSGDQALYTVYARQISEGAVLYRDLFDVKLPGIFAFYAAGGMLFGFTEIGIHLLELLYWLAFSAFAVVALRPYFTARWAAPLVPVLTVAYYYLYARPYDLTQTEILVAFPLLVTWWLVDQADPRTRSGLRRYAAAGLVASTVVLLKHLYLLIVLGFLAYTMLRQRPQRLPAADPSRALATFCLTLLVPLLLVVAYFAAHGQLGRILWTYLDFAPAARTLMGPDVSELIGGARRFAIGHGPILILAALGTVGVLRRRAQPQLDLVAGMVVWTAIGTVAFYVQFWGEYKWLLFTVPLGILAVLGVEALATTAKGVPQQKPCLVMLPVAALLGVVIFWVAAPAPHVQTWLLGAVVVGVGAGVAVELLTDRPPGRWRFLQVLVAALSVSVGVMAIGPIGKLGVLVEHDLALTPEARNDFQGFWHGPYWAAEEDLQRVADGEGVAGPIYVFGDPVLLLRAKQPQPVAVSGWSYEVYDRRVWQELHRDLRSAMPSYIVIHEPVEPFVRTRYPALLDFVDSEYEVAFHGESGTWHVRAPAARAPR